MVTFTQYKKKISVQTGNETADIIVLI